MISTHRRAVLLAVPAALLLCAGAAQAQQPGPVLVVGDSLQVGTGPHLKRELGGDVTVAARSGRPSAEGLGVLRRRIRPAHRVVVFDLGTNDPPAQPERLRGALAAARQLAGTRCLVVATLVRPALDGVSIEGMNEVVREFASGGEGVKLADWRAATRRSPKLLGRDRVHATRAGYAARARLIADAVRSCPRRSVEAEAAEPDASPPRIAAGGVVSRAVEWLPVHLPLELLRGVRELALGVVGQAEGMLVPIAPDAVLGSEKDPLGRREP